MIEPAATAETPAVNPQQFFPVGAQIPGMFANHIFVATDGSSVYLTFSQASPVQPQIAVVGPQKLDSVPMIASPVAKVVLMPSILPTFIEHLQALWSQFEQHKTT